MTKALAISIMLLALVCDISAQAPVRYEIPRAIKGEQIINRQAYSVSHNQLYNLANWVAYVLTAQETVPVVSRFEGRFTSDPEIENCPDTTDYARSGYDRGHLAPAADMEFRDKAIMQESFFFSNIAPQTPAFNRGIWKRLECLQRLWAQDYDSIYIVTGPVLKGKLRTIGDHNVAVPRYFYKVIMRREKDGRYVGAGFVLPNRDARSQLCDRMVSIDSVESITGINFFHLLPDNIERPMERVACRECWNWHKGNTMVDPPAYASGIYDDARHKPNDGTSTQPPNYGKKNDGKSATPGKSRQCKGITKSGKRCSRQTTDPSGYCHQHK